MAMMKDKLAQMAGVARADLSQIEERQDAKGIGHQGKTLLQMLHESEERFKRTGCYQGLQSLTLKESDPMGFEKSFSKLRGALVSARETAMRISASPIVRNIGELCFSLYTPEGDSICLSTGIIVHVHTMSEAVKYMIRKNYEEEPGIHHGDIFCNNDAAIGDIHTADVATIVPLFWERELIGWAAGVTHQVDIGASVQGHDPVQTQNRFEDGYCIPCEKIGENDKVYKTHRLRSQSAVRTPMFWDLDEKARVAGCHMIRHAVERFVSEVGIDHYRRFAHEAVEESRRIFRARVRERLLPGVYKAASFSEVAFAETPEGRVERARVDQLMHAPVELTITPEGDFKMSMEGASPYGQHPFNASLAGMQGALWVLLSQMLFFDGRVNDGAYFAVEHHFPPGSWCNPEDPLVAYGTAWGFLIPSYTGLFRNMARAFYARGYREEVVCGYGFTGDASQGGGVLENGLYFPLAAFDLSSVGMGAGAIRDGLDYGYAVWNPECDLGDVEVWESMELGMPWLGRGVMPDTAGFGKYRGATAWENIRLVSGVKGAMLHYVVRPDGLVFHGGGIMGGYPHATGHRLYYHDTNFSEVISKKQPYPVSTGSIGPENCAFDRMLKGTAYRSERSHTLGRFLRNDDLMHNPMSGSPALAIRWIESQPRSSGTSTTGSTAPKSSSVSTASSVCSTRRPIHGRSTKKRRTPAGRPCAKNARRAAFRSTNSTTANANSWSRGS
jgi:N-methylhydantoinase B/acetone carboxylase alpha subunit